MCPWKLLQYCISLVTFVVHKFHFSHSINLKFCTEHDSIMLSYERRRFSEIQIYDGFYISAFGFPQISSCWIEPPTYRTQRWQKNIRHKADNWHFHNSILYQVFWIHCQQSDATSFLRISIPVLVAAFDGLKYKCTEMLIHNSVDVKVCLSGFLHTCFSRHQTI